MAVLGDRASGGLLPFILIFPGVKPLMTTSTLKKLSLAIGVSSALSVLNFVFLPKAEAAVIRSPISATASSELSSNYLIGNTINQSGLNLNFVSGVTDFDTYFSAPNTTHTHYNVGFTWFSDGLTKLLTPSATLNYDLGGVFTIDRLALWNSDYNGIGSLNILTSTDGVAFASLASGLTPSNNPLGNDYPATVFGLNSVAARFVRLEISCPVKDDYNVCGMGEIAFSTATAAVPTPALLPGLIGLGVAALRKRKIEAADSANKA
jgi:hypothetical protein